MSRSSSAQFSVIIQTDHLERAVQQVEASGALEGLGWSISVVGNFDDPYRAQSLISRIRKRHDEILLSGYAGVPHQILLEGELDAEVGWAFTNPWRNGLLDLSPDLSNIEDQDFFPWFMPRDSDYFRDVADVSYRKHARRLVTVESASDEGSRDQLRALQRLLGQAARSRRPVARIALMRLRVGSVETLLPCVMPIASGEGSTPRDDSRMAKMFARLLRHSRSSFVLLIDDPQSGATSEGSAGPTLSAISGPLADAVVLTGAQPVRLASLQGTPAAAVEGGREHRSAGSDDGLKNPKLQLAASELRATRGGGERRIRSVLEAIHQDRTGSVISEAERPFPQEREVIASMFGSARLSGPGFDVTFIDGRFSGVFAGQDSFQLAEPAHALFIAEGQRHAYRCDGAFSFESSVAGRAVRGIVSTFSVAGEGLKAAGSMSVHASFVEGCAPLILDTFIRLPELPGPVGPVEYRPFVLPLLCSTDENPEIEVATWYPDGTVSRAKCNDSRPDIVMFGSVFSCTLGAKQGGTGVNIAFADGRLKVIRSIRCRLERGKGGALFSAYIAGGTATQEQEHPSGMAEHLTILVVPAAGKELDLPPAELLSAFQLPPAVRRQLQSPWITG